MAGVKDFKSEMKQAITLTFEEYGILTLQNSEEIAKHLKDNNISIAGISREYVLRTFGIELANKVFPQYKFENSKGTTIESDNRTICIVNKIRSKIEEKGYCFEKEIAPSRYSATFSQWKRSIQEILTTYGLIKVKLNNKLKEEYNISCKGYPSIIVREH